MRFYWLLCVTWRKSSGSYHAGVDIVLQLLPLKRNQARVKEVLFYVQGKKQTRLESADVDIKRLVANAVPESAKKSTKYEQTSIS